MIKVVYFASIREQLGVDQEQLADTPATVNLLVDLLCQRGTAWQQVFQGGQPVLVAVNQEMSQTDAVLTDGDEVAFFPPVTGG